MGVGVWGTGAAMRTMEWIGKRSVAGAVDDLTERAHRRSKAMEAPRNFASNLGARAQTHSQIILSQNIKRRKLQRKNTKADNNNSRNRIVAVAALS